jgi:hypothetical protein
MRNSGGIATNTWPARTRAEVAQEQRAEQRGDVQAVGVGVGEDADLAVAQPGQIVVAGVHADGDGDVVHFLRGQHLALIRPPRCSGSCRAAAGSPGTRGRAPAWPSRRRSRPRPGTARRARGPGGAVGELAGQGGPCGDLLAPRPFGGAQRRLRALDRQFGDALAILGVLVQPQAEGILDHASTKAPLARGQALLGLAGELRVRSFTESTKLQPLPDVLGRQLDAARQQVAELAELAQRIGQARCAGR